MTQTAPVLDLNGLTLVVGLGVTGLSCVRTLSRLGAELAVADSRPRPPGLETLQRDFPAVPHHLGDFDPALFAAARRLLVSPGVAVSTPVIAEAAARGVEVLGDIELFARLCRAPVAAITGSNGKSTVTTLLGAMARAAGRRVAVGGNLGTPALDLLDATVELYVLELSSFQLETTSSLNARVATVLNLSPDHLDRYPDLDAYAAVKARIFRGDGVMVLNGHDPRVVAMAEPERRVSRFYLDQPAPGDFGLLAWDGQTWLAQGREPWLSTNRLPVSGAHNQANALAALAMGEALGLDRAAMVAALTTFEGLPHRTQLVAERHGVRWYDDSKGTNVGATVAAVAGLPGPLVVILGGDGKGQDFSALREPLARKARAAVLIGQAAPRIEAALAGMVPVCHVSDMDEAVAQAARLARPGDSVLLSPACASFDMFSNYMERGRVFAVAARRVTA